MGGYPWPWGQDKVGCGDPRFHEAALAAYHLCGREKDARPRVGDHDGLRGVRRGGILLFRVLTTSVVFIAIPVSTVVLIVAAVIITSGGLIAVAAIFVVRAGGFLLGILFFALLFKLKEFSFLVRAGGSLGLPG